MFLYEGDTIYYYGGVYVITAYFDGIYNRVEHISGVRSLHSTRCYPYRHLDESFSFYLISRANSFLVHHHHLKAHSFLECVD